MISSYMESVYGSQTYKTPDTDPNPFYWYYHTHGSYIRW